MSPLKITQAARDRLADEIAAQGPALSNLAGNVRAGFENFWITPALQAIERLLRDLPAEDDE